MKKLAPIIFFGCILFCQTLNAQNIANDEDAINIFKSHPPKYGCEGIYDIYMDVKELSYTNPDLNQEYTGLKSEGKKVCIYFDGNKIIAQIIGVRERLFNSTDGKSQLGEFIFDAFDILRFNYSFHSSTFHLNDRDLKISYDPDNELKSAIVNTENGNLSFEVNSPLCNFDNAYTVFRSHRFFLKNIYHPGQNTNTPESINISSGTGFALTSNGYIVTNNHVVKGAKTITVKGVNGNFQNAYSAHVIIVDKNNDLAIIQIDDPAFNSLGKIPYVISNKTSDAGSAVFVLGYPLRASMGDEIKLTNGIISSKSGYQGDVTTYQISVPLQPGNSGGPMFDANGNLIGVVNAKLTGAENASYAIKTSYLFNLIETLGTFPQLQNVSALAGKPLTEQVKALKNFTYIIEVD